MPKYNLMDVPCSVLDFIHFFSLFVFFSSLRKLIIPMGDFQAKLPKPSRTKIFQMRTFDSMHLFSILKSSNYAYINAWQHTYSVATAFQYFRPIVNTPPINVHHFISSIIFFSVLALFNFINLTFSTLLFLAILLFYR